jgi:hypothetical protein
MSITLEDILEQISQSLIIFKDNDSEFLGRHVIASIMDL